VSPSGRCLHREHQQTMFHQVDLDHGEGRAGPQRHGSHHKSGGISGDKRADVKSIVAQKGCRRSRFPYHDKRRRGDAR
jgi:hypothetical protein